MRQTARAILAAVFAAVGIFSVSISAAQQPQQTNHLQFEVASIKPGNPPADSRLGLSRTDGGGMPGGKFRMVNIPLRQWVETGLSVRDYALKAPAWLDTSRFDLVAKLPNRPLDQKSLPEMMKALLIERFGLKWHEEHGIVSGYELVADKKVLVQPASLLERLRGVSGSGSGPTAINGTNMPMSRLAELLGDALGRPVVDATHLTGGYDIQLRWRPLDPAAVAEQKKYDKQYGYDVDSLSDSVFTAIREELGLRLQPAKVPSTVIVVDNINRQPTAN